MSHIWTFSTHSKLILEQCLSAATEPDSSNIWYQRFGLKNSEQHKNTENILIQGPQVNDTKNDNNSSTHGSSEDILNTLERFMDPEIDVTLQLGKLEEICVNKPEVLHKLAENFSKCNMLKLIQYIFDGNEISKQLLSGFFEYCLPVFIKKENSRLCIDLLKQTFRFNQDFFEIVLRMVVKDLEIQSNIVSDFILALTVDEQTSLLTSILCFELTSEQFLYNLHGIFAIYKNCNRTEVIQNHIFNSLKLHSQFCINDNIYGKLLLSYLQEVKYLNQKIDKDAVKKILEIHRSPFRRPCLAVLNELNDS